MLYMDTKCATSIYTVLLNSKSIIGTCTVHLHCSQASLRVLMHSEMWWSFKKGVLSKLDSKM